MDKSRLYYQTPYVKSFMCTVKRCEASGKGTWYVVLDQTGFYPEGGGQPWDLGTLDGIEVLSVEEKEGEVIHETASPLDPGMPAKGIIDWKRRYDHMQQHTGEHILSGLVHRHFGYDNVGFHMGEDEMTVDFNGVITPEELDMLEDEANEIVYQNVPVTVAYPSAKELSSMDYRSKKELFGLVRIVTVEGADTCACCGTHVEKTGEVGMIKIRSMIRYKGGVRITMICGRKALLDYRQRLKDEMRISNLLSAKLELVPQAVEKLKKDSQDREFLLVKLQNTLLEIKTGSFPASESPLMVFEEDLSPVQVRQYATLLYEQGKASVAGVCSGTEGNYHYALGSAERDMRVLSKALNRVLAGKGGGSSLMAQGTFQADRADIETAFAELTEEKERED